MSTAARAPLIAALDAWQTEGRLARFWLRDDDAVAPTSGIDTARRSLRRASRSGSPGRILAHTGAPLARHLGGRTDIEVALHGWSHENHAPPDEKKQELGAHRAADIARPNELSAGRETGRNRFLANSSSPCWSLRGTRIDKALLPRLGDIGIAGLSVFGPERWVPCRLSTRMPILWTGMALAAAGLPAISLRISSSGWARCGAAPARWAC